MHGFESTPKEISVKSETKIWTAGGVGDGRKGGRVAVVEVVVVVCTCVCVCGGECNDFSFGTASQCSSLSSALTASKKKGEIRRMFLLHF